MTPRRPRLPGRSIVVATRNPHKVEELGEILAGIELLPLPDDVVMPPEDAPDFAGNALGKARAAFEQTGAPALADDSGIEAHALGGRPGVRSARYAGPDATDAENLELLLREMSGRDDRSVAYVCAVAFIDEDGAELVREARCEGVLAEVPRGEGGFGYDPAFLPVEIGDGRTMAELSPEEKHAISHRGRAARAVAAAIGAGG